MNAEELIKAIRRANRVYVWAVILGCDGQWVRANVSHIQNIVKSIAKEKPGVHFDAEFRDVHNLYING